MKIVFVSNYINHHQIPFSNALYRTLKENYCFIETVEMEYERIQLGWNLNDEFPYILRAYRDEETLCLAHQLVNEADVVILGGISGQKWLKDRKENKKLTFIYSERIYKQGMWKVLSRKNRAAVRREYIDFQDDNFYLLSASAYLPIDISLYGGYKNKMFKWGYFPAIKSDMVNRKRHVVNLLWVGRFIDWKHPELFVKLVNALVKKNYDIRCKMVGNGPLLNDVANKIKYFKLEKYIELCGSLPVDQVRITMEESDIFITTSDYQEGWGAVVNEAMSSKCVVICSHAMGSVPYLIKHGENGLIFKSNSLKSLVKNTLKVLDDPELQYKLSNNAYDTIQKEWNADVAAKRILEISEALLVGKYKIYEEGPCSIAPVILQHDMYRKMVK